MLGLYERNINSCVKKISANKILTSASLLDLNHSMRVELTINLKSLIIEKTKAVILKAPLGVCNQTTVLIKKLEGLKLERGINRKLIEALGTADGCTHLYELSLNAIRLSYNVLIGINFNWKEWVNKSLSDEEFVKKAKPWLKNACYPFRE
ncbi:MAG: DUF2889 domain-containing protein [Deltaproteobacteria bacterium]|nr:DUF2889 domain-containing protein [Deltaproteobacteria bacterium]